MKWLLIITLTLGLIITAIALDYSSTLPVTAFKQSGHADNTNKKASSTPQLIAQPEQQRQRLFNHVGLNEAQQLQFQSAVAAFGQQRKHLLQQRKSLLVQTYRLKLAAIKKQHEQTLLKLMGVQRYQQFESNLAYKRSARYEKASHHVQQHRFTGRKARRMKTQ